MILISGQHPHIASRQSKAKHPRMVNPVDIPLRLSEEEREILKVLNAALRVSEYTDDVDSYRLRRSNVDETCKRSMIEFFTTMTGMMLAGGLIPKDVKEALSKGGMKVTHVEPMLQRSFEIGRRFKQLNPREMPEYGKLLMILQDARRTNMFAEPPTPIITVGTALGALKEKFFADKTALDVATDPMPPCKDAKAAAAAKIIDAVESPDFKSIFERCIKSISDHKSFIKSCTEPIDLLLKWLEVIAAKGPSIDIVSGKGGACFTHSHTTHCQYVKESLTLWKIIQRDIFDFWQCVERDMIIDASGCNYRFVDTGQGFHRMSEAPKSYHRMSKAIAEAESAMGGKWVGIKVVHLGDRDVPNPLVFIDKYTVIPRLLNPVVRTIEALDAIFDPSQLEEHPGIRNFLRGKYGSSSDLKAVILQDFFRFAFDGSGDDGGSCIDGRLTSAWNWCSLLHKKHYFDAFTLTGFLGFD